MQVMHEDIDYDEQLHIALKHKSKTEKNILIHEYLIDRIDHLELIIIQQRRLLEKLTGDQLRQIEKLTDEKIQEPHLQKLREQSRKNAEELRKLVGLPVEYDNIDPKNKLKGLLFSHSDKNDVDSLEILKSIREKNE